MKLILIFLLTCAALPLFGAIDEEISLSSKHANYNGNEIELSGDVVLEHSLGSIYADQMTLIKGNKETKIRFPIIVMENHVRFVLENGAQLLCEKADLNYLTMTGQFLSGTQQPFVIYSDLFNESGNVCLPFVVQSRRMRVNISEKADNVNLATYVSSLTAEEDVQVSYHRHFRAFADKAVYHRKNSEDRASGRSLEGIIYLEANGNDGKCRLTNTTGDLIDAEEIRIDTKDRKIAFVFPKGKVHIMGLEGVVEEVDFSSDTMTWDKERETIVLRERVIFNQQGIGTVKGDDEVKLSFSTVDGKKQIETLLANGKTVLSYLNDEHMLTSYGTLQIDHRLHQTVLEGPRDEAGKVPREEQVFLQDPMGTIKADKMTLLYRMDGNRFVPKKFIIEGNVHILNRFGREQSNSVMQYALADVVEYTIDTQEMALGSRENPRVLFFDKINNINVSAPTLKVKRDPHTKKESIQGSGDVRFNFVEQELDALRKQFNLVE